MRLAALALALALPAGASGYTLVAAHPVILDVAMFAPDAANLTLSLGRALIPSDPALPYNGMIFSGFALPANTAIQVFVRGAFTFSTGFDIAENGSHTWAGWAPRGDLDPYAIEYYDIANVTLRLGFDCLPGCRGMYSASESAALLGRGTIQLATFRPSPPIPEPGAFAAFGLGLAVVILAKRHGIS